MGVGDLVGQHPIDHGARPRARARAGPCRSRTPAPLPLNAFGDRIGPFQDPGVVADALQFGLAAQALLDQAGDPRLVSLRDSRIAQGDDHAVARLALGVAIGLQ